MKFIDMIKEYETLKIKEKELKDALREPVSIIVLLSLEASLKKVEEAIKSYEETNYITQEECNSRVQKEIDYLLRISNKLR